MRGELAEDVLVLDGLAAGYRNQPVLHDISCRVAEGTLVSVIGPNGHGKSTLLRTISGLTYQTAGDILVGGRSIVSLTIDERVEAGICHVPQGDLLFSGMSVRDNLLMGCYRNNAYLRRDRSLEKVYELLPRLRERDRQLASTLSGGERRMLALGRGLMMNTPIMLIDEPSLGLAPIAVEQIYAFVASLKAGGQTIMLVEENPDRVCEVADFVHVLDGGRFVWSGKPDKLVAEESVISAYLGT